MMITWVIFFVNRGLDENSEEDAFSVCLLYKRLEKLVSRDIIATKSIKLQAFFIVLQQEKQFFEDIKVFLSLLKLFVEFIQNFSVENPMVYTNIRHIHELNEHIIQQYEDMALFHSNDVQINYGYFLLLTKGNNP